MNSETSKREFQDIQQLCYLGMRAAFGHQHSRRYLRGRARACVVGKLRTLREWSSAGPFPPIRIEGGRHLRTSAESGRGAIVCAAHVGPYHRIPLELVAKNLNVTLLLDTINFEREKSWYGHWRSEYKGPLADPMQYINAELPQATWEMTRALRSGRILFVYMDGNAGLEGADTAKNLAEVAFGGLRIRVRKGFSYVSAFVGAPIVPVISRYTQRGGHVMRFESRVEKSPKESTDDYCRRAMQHLFSILETYAIRDPACWEEWAHVYRWQVREPLWESTRVLAEAFDPDAVLDLTLAVDVDNVELLRMSEGNVLASVRSGAALLVTEAVADILQSLDARITLGKALDCLRGKHDEALLLEVLHALCAGGFVRAIDHPGEATQAPSVLISEEALA